MTKDGASRRRVGRSLKPFRWPWLWAGVWSCAVAAVVVLSLAQLPDIDLPPNSDKVEHVLGYALLAAGAVQIFAKRLALFSTCVLLVLLGIGLEFAQNALTSYRQMDPNDALANTIGVLLGLATVMTPARDWLLRWERRVLASRHGEHR